MKNVFLKNKNPTKYDKNEYKKNESTEINNSKILKILNLRGRLLNPKVESPTESPAVAIGFKYRVATTSFYPKEGNLIENPSLQNRDSKFRTSLDERKVLGTFHLPYS